MFNEALNRQHHDLLTMGALVEENIRKALEALRNADQALADEVKASDTVINALQIKIDDQTARLLATQQPLARDLRELVTSLKITDNLERIGDYAVHLAKAAKRLAEEPYPRPLDRLERMALQGCAMVHDAVRAYLEQDEALARSTAALDDTIDRDHKAFVAEVLALMSENPGRARQATKLISTSNYLERLGDHVTNICEAVIFMTSGEHVELN